MMMASPTRIRIIDNHWETRKARKHQAIRPHSFDDHPTKTIPDKGKGYDLTLPQKLGLPTKNQDQKKSSRFQLDSYKNVG